MSEKVCKGRFGEIPKNDSSSDRVYGIEMKCPDGTEVRIQGEKETSVPEAKRILSQKGYNAEIVDETN